MIRTKQAKIDECLIYLAQGLIKIKEHCGHTIMYTPSGVCTTSLFFIDSNYDVWQIDSNIKLLDVIQFRTIVERRRAIDKIVSDMIYRMKDYKIQR